MNKHKYIKPKLFIKKIRLNLLYSSGKYSGIDDLLFQDVYAQSYSLYLPIVISDERLKKDIVHTSRALKTVKKMHGVYFQWKHQTSQEKEFGLIAQDVKKVFPESVVIDKKTGIHMVNYASIVALLVEGVKEQQETIQALSQTVQSLKSQINESK